jgi:hypothetical protein
MFFDSGKVVVNPPSFTTHSTTNSPRITTTFHHKIRKTPAKSPSTTPIKKIEFNLKVSDA